MISKVLDPVLVAAGIKSPQIISSSRAFDIVIAFIALFVLTGAYHLHFMLVAGDWDFWVDWKDRRFWVTLTPIVAIMFPAATQAFLWSKFRLPIGATLCVTGLMLAEWVVRIFGWHGLAGFPYSLVWPATLIPSALLLDAVLLLTRSWLMTGIVGGWLFGIMFYPANWTMLAAYRMPVLHLGQLTSVGDLIGYSYIRSATPEYLRIIERGTLRTFGGHSAVISAFFSAFVCVVTYFVWWFIGILAMNITYLPSKLKKYMGLANEPTPKAADETVTSAISSY
jgi:methane/ammonia monooxygenase subunit A